MDKNTWLSLKYDQVRLYQDRANRHRSNRRLLLAAAAFFVITGIILPFVLFELGYEFENPLLYLLAVASFILIPVSLLVWKLSTYQNRSRQLLIQLADLIKITLLENANKPLDEIRSLTTQIETRFLSNDDELFIKKALWSHFMFIRNRRFKEIEEWRIGQRQPFMTERERLIRNHEYEGSPFVRFKNQEVFLRWELGPIWNTDIPHRQGYKDSNTIFDEWAIVKGLRYLFFQNNVMVYERISAAISDVAIKNPVVYERFLRKKRISKSIKKYKKDSRIHYLSAAAKMRLVTFVEQVLALEPTNLNPEVAPLLHEKNQQIQRYTDEFWKVHRRSIKFYWFEALWLLLLVPFIGVAANLISNESVLEAVIVFTVGASLVAFGEMALIVSQQIKLNGKKLIPPLIASLIGSRHAMCADTDCKEGVENYRRRFKNMEKHFIMTTPEIDSVKYVKENLQDEIRTSKLHEADDICRSAEARLEKYHTMFHLYRKRCLQYGALEMFMALMLIPVWGGVFIGAAMIGYVGFDLIIHIMITLTILAFEIFAVVRHVRVWRFKEMYFKIYQGLSVLIVDGDLRQNPNKLNEMFKEIEQSAMEAISSDPAMKLMVNTLSSVSGLMPPVDIMPHELDIELSKIL